MRILVGFYFYPRGGSAHATRATVRELAARDWDATLLAGSRTDLADTADAEEFFAPATAAGACLHTVDYTDAIAAQRSGALPASGAVPMHCSYEDRPGAEDVVFAALSDEELELQVEAWTRELVAAGAGTADLLLLHHLTPMHEAAARLFGDTPVISHIHGSELLMLEAIEEAPGRWKNGERWAERLREWAASSTGLIVNDPAGAVRAAGLLEVAAEDIIVLPNGFDPEFHPVAVDGPAHWRRHLVDAPLGWAPGKGPGSIGYSEEDVQLLDTATVLLYVGRFTAVKRLSLLIETFAAARERFLTPTALVLLGGFPGEWEDEHPLETLERVGAEGVYLAGWHQHSDLPSFLSAADLLVHPAVREQFGLVIVEAMACEVPPVAVDRGGPAGIIEAGQTGWLVEPDSATALADAMVEAVNDPEERRRRGRAAAQSADERYAWGPIGDELSERLVEAASLPRVQS